MSDQELIEQLEQHVALHLEACDEALDEGCEDGWMNSPAIAPYCGCQTCWTRETLYAAAEFLDVHPDVIPVFLNWSR